MKSNIVQNSLTKESIFIIGYVDAVEGRNVKIRVNKNKNASHLLYNGDILKNVSVGGFVKITKGFVEIIGKVEGEYTRTEKFYNEEYRKDEDKIVRYLDISLSGHFDGNSFTQGIKEMPLIDNECYLLDKDEFNRLHEFFKKRYNHDLKLYEADERTITLGALTEEPSQEIKVSTNNLFASHIGIFGNTGSGKSNTLAKIYHELFSQLQSSSFKENSKFIIIDFNGEYGKKATSYEQDEIITGSKKVYFLNTQKRLEEITSAEKLPISEKDLIDVELISILANATDKTQKPFIRRAIEFYSRVMSSVNDHGENDPLAYFKNLLKKRLKLIFQMAIKDKSTILLDYVKYVLEDTTEENDYDWSNSFNYYYLKTAGHAGGQITIAQIEQTDIYRKIDQYNFPDNAITKLIHFLYLQLIFDVYYDKAQNDHIAPAVHKLQSKQKDIEKVLDTEADRSIFPDGINLAIINLKKTNLEIKKTLPLLIAKKLYEQHKDNFEGKSLHIIIDEAHNILSNISERESDTWKDYRLETFEEIIKEGRKFNTFLTIASQRPYDISPTIISQLHNYFIHRLINDYDIKAIEKTVAYLDKLSFESIPILSVGSCFFAGLASNMPVKVSIELLDENNQPRSGTIKLETIWEDTVTTRLV